MTIAELKEKLKKTASKPMRTDDGDFNAFEESGGNFDDAYSMGVEDGEISLARTLLRDLGD